MNEYVVISAAYRRKEKKRSNLNVSRASRSFLHVRLASGNNKYNQGSKFIDFAEVLLDSPGSIDAILQFLQFGEAAWTISLRNTSNSKK